MFILSACLQRRVNTCRSSKEEIYQDRDIRAGGTVLREKDRCGGV